MRAWKDENGLALHVGDTVMLMQAGGPALGVIVGHPDGGLWMVRREKIFNRDTMQLEALPSGGPHEAYDRPLWPELSKWQWRRMGWRIPGVTLIQRKPLRPWRPGLPNRPGIDFEAPMRAESQGRPGIDFEAPIPWAWN